MRVLRFLIVAETADTRGDSQGDLVDLAGLRRSFVGSVDGAERIASIGGLKRRLAAKFANSTSRPGIFPGINRSLGNGPRKVQRLRSDVAVRAIASAPRTRIPMGACRRFGSEYLATQGSATPRH